MKETEEEIDPIIQFRRAAIAKGDGVSSSSEVDHVLHAQMAHAIQVLYSRNDHGAAALKQLARDVSPHVRQWAAAELLSRGDTSAVASLEELAASGGMVRHNAELVLKEYRAGKL